MILNDIQYEYVGIRNVDIRAPETAALRALRSFQWQQLLGFNQWTLESVETNMVKKISLFVNKKKYVTYKPKLKLMRLDWYDYDWETQPCHSLNGSDPTGSLFEARNLNEISNQVSKQR